MLKKPLGFYPASIFHRKWEKVLEFFEKKIFEKKSEIAGKTKTTGEGSQKPWKFDGILIYYLFQQLFQILLCSEFLLKKCWCT